MRPRPRSWLLDRRLTLSSQAIIRERSRVLPVSLTFPPSCRSFFGFGSAMAKPGGDAAGVKPETALVRAGRDKHLTGQFINPPVIHASTVLFDSVDDMLERRQRYTYGRRGTPTIEALARAVSELEGAAGTVLCPSGLSAISTALLSCVSAGDQILMADCVYAPSRHFTDGILKRLGIETVYFDPTIGAGIE